MYSNACMSDQPLLLLRPQYFYLLGEHLLGAGLFRRPSVDDFSFYDWEEDRSHCESKKTAAINRKK